MLQEEGLTLLDGPGPSLMSKMCFLEEPELSLVCCRCWTAERGRRDSSMSRVETQRVSFEVIPR